MKPVFVFIAVLLSTILGFVVGRGTQQQPTLTNTIEVVAESAEEQHEEVIPTEPTRSDSGTSQVESKSSNKKLTNKERGEKFEKVLEKYMNAAPLALVQKIYYKRSANTDELAFSGNLEKGDWDSDQRKEIEQAIFERSLPILKQGLYYYAQGSLRFDNKDLPYEVLLSFQEYPSKEELKGKLPNDPKDLSYSIIFMLDATELDPKKGKIFLNTGGGFFYLYNDGGRTFLRTENYNLDSDSELKNMMYYLIEAPNQEESAGVIRIFNLKTNQWEEVTDQLSWRRLSKSDYLEAKEAILK